MRIRQHAIPLTFWLFAVAVLLKSATPLLATASANMQGKPLVEVCTAYGVALVALDCGSPQSTAAEHRDNQGGGHCALSG